jgi:hypothetical protein
MPARQGPSPKGSGRGSYKCRSRGTTTCCCYVPFAACGSVCICSYHYGMYNSSRVWDGRVKKRTRGRPRQCGRLWRDEFDSSTGEAEDGHCTWVDLLRPASAWGASASRRHRSCCLSWEGNGSAAPEGGLSPEQGEVRQPARLSGAVRLGACSEPSRHCRGLRQIFKLAHRPAQGCCWVCKPIQLRGSRCDGRRVNTTRTCRIGTHIEHDS